jgi:hypothetical protein
MNKIEEISLSGCSMMKADAIIGLSRCTSLTSLSLESGYHVTDASIISLCEYVYSY